jgi:hypothetical protein
MPRLVCVHDGAQHMIAGARHTLGEHVPTLTTIVPDSGSNMNAWDHLPNAKHIDWVIESVKQHPKIWDAAHSAAWGAARGATWEAVRSAARNAARSAAYSAAWVAAWEATREATWDVAWDAAWDAAYDATRDAAYDAILALVAYDDCAHLLDMPSDRLKIWATLSEQPAAVLLLPAVIARERIAQLETV